MLRRPSGSSRGTMATIEVVAAYAVTFLIAFRYRFSPDIPIGFLVALAMIPVTIRVLRLFRGAVLIACLSVTAAVYGVILTIARPVELANGSLLVVQTWRAVGIALVLAALLWVRTVIGTRRLVFTFGLGALATLGLTGLNFDNIWKFSLAVPVTLILLSLPGVYGRRTPQLLIVLGLAAVSAFGDSRSSAGMLLIAAALTLFQPRSGDERPATPGRAWRMLGRVALIGVGGYLAVQAAILEGVLGEAVRARTEMQIEQSGSLLVGGRPEMGAAVALISERPWGYGAGALASYREVVLGKSGMASLGYDPNNGYVENYMFGYGFEVHSLAGDLWLLYGFAGIALAVTILVACLFSVGTAMSVGGASTVAIFLALRLTWDFAFSPFPSAMFYLPLALAVTLTPRLIERTNAPPQYALTAPTNLLPAGTPISAATPSGRARGASPGV